MNVRFDISVSGERPRADFGHSAAKLIKISNMTKYC